MLEVKMMEVMKVVMRMMDGGEEKVEIEQA